MPSEQVEQQPRPFGPRPAFLDHQLAEQKLGGAVDKAFSSRQTELVALEYGEREPKFSTQLEVTKVDTEVELAAQPEKQLPRPRIVNFTGVWGQGDQVEAELITMATAMGEQGLKMDMVSLPGHGRSEDLLGGWDSPNAFKRCAEVMVAYLEKIKAETPDQPIILNAWSMGGVTAINIAAMRPDLVDGLILIDTPVFKQQFFATFLRFAMYPVNNIIRPHQKVEREEKLALEETKLKGLAVFGERIRDRNKPEGMPLGKVVLASAKQLCNQDLAEGENSPLRRVAKSGIPTLLLYGDNDLVIRRPMMNRLRNYVRAAAQGNMEAREIPHAGHSSVDERPRAVGAVVEDWLGTTFTLSQDRARAE